MQGVIHWSEKVLHRGRNKSTRLPAVSPTVIRRQPIWRHGKFSIANPPASYGRQSRWGPFILHLTNNSLLIHKINLNVVLLIIWSLQCVFYRVFTGGCHGKWNTVITPGACIEYNTKSIVQACTSRVAKYWGSYYIECVFGYRLAQHSWHPMKSWTKGKYTYQHW